MKTDRDSNNYFSIGIEAEDEIVCRLTIYNKSNSVVKTVNQTTVVAYKLNNFHHLDVKLSDWFRFEALATAMGNDGKSGDYKRVVRKVVREVVRGVRGM